MLRSNNHIVSISDSSRGYSIERKHITKDGFEYTKEQREADRRIKNGENILIMGPGVQGKHS